MDWAKFFETYAALAQRLFARLCGELPIRVVKRGLTFPGIHILEMRFMKHEEE
jgi:hypothetical protein